MCEIKNQLHKSLKNNWSVPYNLIIEGGEGHGNKNSGGCYKYTASYLNPAELYDRDLISLDIWCEKMNLPYVTASTFSELLEKLKSFDRS